MSKRHELIVVLTLLVLFATSCEESKTTVVVRQQQERCTRVDIAFFDVLKPLWLKKVRVDPKDSMHVARIYNYEILDPPSNTVITATLKLEARTIRRQDQRGSVKIERGPPIYLTDFCINPSIFAVPGNYDTDIVFRSAESGLCLQSCKVDVSVVPSEGPLLGVSEKESCVDSCRPYSFEPLTITVPIRIAVTSP